MLKFEVKGAHEVFRNGGQVKAPLVSRTPMKGDNLPDEVFDGKASVIYSTVQTRSGSTGSRSRQASVAACQPVIQMGCRC